MTQQASFVWKMKVAFQLKNKYFPTKLTESAAKETETLNRRCSSVETRHFTECIIYYIIIYYIYIYIYIACLLTWICSKLCCFKRPWNCPFLKHFALLVWKSMWRACEIQEMGNKSIYLHLKLKGRPTRDINMKTLEKMLDVIWMSLNKKYSKHLNFIVWQNFWLFS